MGQGVCLKQKSLNMHEMNDKAITLPYIHITTSQLLILQHQSTNLTLVNCNCYIILNTILQGRLYFPKIAKFSLCMGLFLHNRMLILRPVLRLTV